MDDASEGFEALAHPTRMGVLRALFEADSGLRFSELRKSVEATDSGNFSYHLDRLVGRFVRKSGQTYRLTERGFEVGITVVSGTYGDDEPAERIEGLGRCLFCGEPADAVFERGTSVLECSNGHRTYVAPLPAEAVEERDESEFGELVATELYATVGRVLRGTCTACRCPVSGGLEATEEGPMFRADCGFCGVEYAVPAGLCALQDPEVLSFLHDRSADPRTTPPWLFEWCQPGTGTTASEDPLRVRVKISRDDDERAVVVDTDGSVRSITEHR